MIYKGIIEEVIDAYQYRVRIPLLHRTKLSNNYTNTQDLPIACICTLPRTSIYPRINDVVIIGFENNDQEKPVILGYLFRETANELPSSIQATSLTVSGDTYLSRNTNIGDVSPESLQCLKGLNQNICYELTLIKNKIESLEEEIKLLKESVN